MSTSADLLSTLRDIHEPLAPDAPSLMWTLLPLLIGIALLCLLLFLYFKNRRKHVDVRQLHICTARGEPPEQARLRLARLLRHICLSSTQLEENKNINSLTGEQWLEHLNNTFSTNYFTHGNGVLFGQSLYRPLSSDVDMQLICDELAQVIK